MFIFTVTMLFVFCYSLVMFIIYTIVEEGKVGFNEFIIFSVIVIGILFILNIYLKLL